MGRRAAAAGEPLGRLIQFEATDGVELSGMLFEPKRSTRRAIVFLHGTGGSSIFGSSRTNLVAANLTRRGFAWFPFDNRGSQVIRRLRGRKRSEGGSAHEIIRECVFDIDGAARALRQRGYRELILAGHSTGANKIAVYDRRRPGNPFRSYILLGGGDDTGMLYEALGPRRFRPALTRARMKIRDGRGDDLVPHTISAMTLSWRAFLDMANPDGDYNVFPFFEATRGIRLGRKRPFHAIRSIRKPALYVYGEHDEYCEDVASATAILAAEIGPRGEIVTIAGSGHGFSGFEGELAERMADWVLDGGVLSS